MEQILRIGLFPVLVKGVKHTFVFLYLMVALPYFYNMGSSEIGCPIYESRTGNVCMDILGR